jgi:hypothetical protein
VLREALSTRGMATTSSRPIKRQAPVRHSGVAGNSHLTALIGAVLLALLGVQGVTILRIGQLLWLHLFLGVVLAVLVGLKLSSAGYRLAGYYRGRPEYVREGPPHIALRLLAAPLVLATLGIFISGGALLLVGPSIRQPVLLLHKLSFFTWIGFFAIHVLAHLKDVARVLREEFASRIRRSFVRGRGARLGAIGAALLVGVTLAVLLIPHFGAWTSRY